MKIGPVISLITYFTNSSLSTIVFIYIIWVIRSFSVFIDNSGNIHSLDLLQLFNELNPRRN